MCVFLSARAGTFPYFEDIPEVTVWWCKCLVQTNSTTVLHWIGGGAQGQELGSAGSQHLSAVPELEDYSHGSQCFCSNIEVDILCPHQVENFCHMDRYAEYYGLSLDQTGVSLNRLELSLSRSQVLGRFFHSWEVLKESAAGTEACHIVSLASTLDFVHKIKRVPVVMLLSNLSGVDCLAQTRQVQINSPHLHLQKLHTTPNPTYWSILIWYWYVESRL